MKRLFFLLLLTTNAQALSPWLAPGWKKLFHVGRQESEHFFLAGSELHLKEEWFAALRAMASEKDLHTDLHPQCRFPARYRYLKRHSDQSFNDSRCPAFDTWLSSLAPAGASLVFAGNYPDNPGSIFGHTFLKITSSPESRLQFNSGSGKHLDILDYAVNYAAAVSDEQSFLYAMKGLFGGYYGYFSLDPYYVKVNEYNEAEGRDIWEYELSLSPEETTYLLAHYWELKYNALFTYYFLDDNCSFMILALVDVTRPDWKLIEGDNAYVIPLETVKELKKRKGAIRSVRFRPSIRKRAAEAFAGLNMLERRVAKKLTDGELDPRTISNGEVLGASALHFYSERSRRSGNLRPDEERTLAKVLGKLSQIPSPPKVLQSSTPSSGPETGHGVRQISLAAGAREESFLELGHRFGVHDLLDHPVGYLENSELEVMDIRARYQDKRFTLHRINLINLALLRPVELNSQHWSWKTGASFENRSRLFCDSCKTLEASGLGGLTLDLRRELLSFLLLGPYLQLTELAAPRSYGPQALLGLSYRPSPDWQTLIKLKAYQDLRHGQEESKQFATKLGVSYHPRSHIDLNLLAEVPLIMGRSYKGAAELALGIDFHF